MKKIIYIITFVLMLTLVYGYEANFFSNSINQSVAFTGNATQTYFMKVPRYSNYTTANYDIKGFRSPILNLSFYDSFNRSDGSFIGNDWYNGSQASIGTNEVHCKTNISGYRTLFNKKTAVPCLSYISREVSNKTNSTFNVTFDFELQGTSRRVGVDLFSNTSGTTDKGVGMSVVLYGLPEKLILIYVNGTYATQITTPTLAEFTNYSVKITYDTTNNISVKVWPKTGTEPPYGNISAIVGIPFSGEKHNKFYFFGDSSAAQTGRTYIDNINISYEGYSYTKNLKIYTGDNTEDNIINRTRYFNETTKVFYNFTETMTNTTFIDFCNCTACLISGVNCYVPINISSDYAGNLLLYNLTLLYGMNFSLQDCTNNIGIPSYNMSFFDELDDEPIYLNYSAYFSYSFYNYTRDYYISSDSSVSLEMCVYPDLIQLDGDFNVYYSKVNFSNHLYQSNDITYYNYTTYLELRTLNKTDSTTYKEIEIFVIDETLKPLEGATVEVYKQDPATKNNTFLYNLATNSVGKAYTDLNINGLYYYFKVKYQGRTVYSGLNAVQIFESMEQIKLPCVVGEGISDHFISLLGLDLYLNFNKVDNETGNFIILYESDDTVEICLNQTTYLNTVASPLGMNCQNGTSGTITYGTITSTDFITIVGEVFVDFKDGAGSLPYMEVVYYLGLDDDNRSNTGRLLIYIGLIILGGIAFIYEPHVGLIVIALGTLALSFTKFTLINIPISMFIVCLSIFVLITLRKNENK